MKRALLLSPIGVTSVMLAFTTQAQVSFTDNSALLNDTYNSGGVTGVVDMNGDRLDDIFIMDQAEEVKIEYQNPDGSFTMVDYGAISGNSQWGAAVGDVDNDGHKDVFSGGSYDGVHYMRISAPGVFNLTDLNNGTMFMQCANIADMNNDGWLDAMGCHDDADSRIWLNDMTGGLDFNTLIDFTTSPVSDMSGNYGSCWTDFDNDGDIDLYIAKCRQGVNDPTDPRRINVLYVNDGSNNYTNEAPARGIDLGDQSWSADFGDIDNDGDLDLVVTNHDNTIRLFENDGAGFFTEITAGSGLEVTGFFLQSIMRDFDNDGFVDLLISGGVNYLFMNNGDNTFSDATTAIQSTDDLHSFGLGDLNSDGFIDIYASYGDGYVNPDNSNPDKLWLNDGNTNNWIAFELEGVTSNRDAVGAQTRIYGPWGVQMREVRAGESYGINNSFNAHFGLGLESDIDSVVVNWPSGLVDTYTNLSGGQYYTLLEGTCIAPDIEVTYSAPTPFVCTGGSPLTLTGNPGFNYLWSTGDTTQSIDVTTGGNYTLTIDDGLGCVNTMSVNVVQDPDVPPVITSNAGASICDGEQAVLTSSALSSNVWSTGDTTQSITITQTSSVTVSTTGLCGMVMSTPFDVNVYPAPLAPVTTGDNIPSSGPGTITATGTNVEWYDSQIGGTLLGTGSPWTTPTVLATQSFWAQDRDFNEGSPVNGGKLDRDLNFGSIYNNNNRYLVFEAYESFIIQSVKVYADGAGNRTFEIVDQNTGSTVTQGTFMIPDGESRVDLDFYIPAAGEYSLRSVTGAPALWRDSQGSSPAYPFALGTVGSIIRSNANSSLSFYYFWYDWEVTAAKECISDRSEAIVTVSVGIDEFGEERLSIWPNPTNDVLFVEVKGAQTDLVMDISDITGRTIMQGSIDTADLAQGRAVIDVSELAKGDYVLRLSGENGAISQRFVVN